MGQPLRPGPWSGAPRTPRAVLCSAPRKSPGAARVLPPVPLVDHVGSTNHQGEPSMTSPASPTTTTNQPRQDARAPPAPAAEAADPSPTAAAGAAPTPTTTETTTET